YTLPTYLFAYAILPSLITYSSHFFPSYTPLLCLLSRSLPTHRGPTTLYQPLLVRRAPIHSRPAAVLCWGSGQVRGPDRLVLLRSFAGILRSVAQRQHARAP